MGSRDEAGHAACTSPCLMRTSQELRLAWSFKNSNATSGGHAVLKSSRTQVMPPDVIIVALSGEVEEETQAISTLILWSTTASAVDIHCHASTGHHGGPARRCGHLQQS